MVFYVCFLAVVGFRHPGLIGPKPSADFVVSFHHSGSSGLRLLPLLRGPVSRCALLLRFEVGGPPLEFFRYVHELKAARIIPGEFLCQPQARFGPVSEILCIHDASSCAYEWSKITADLEGGCIRFDSKKGPSKGTGRDERGQYPARAAGT